MVRTTHGNIDLSPDPEPGQYKRMHCPDCRVETTHQYTRDSFMECIVCLRQTKTSLKDSEEVRTVTTPDGAAIRCPQCQQTIESVDVFNTYSLGNIIRKAFTLDPCRHVISWNIGAPGPKFPLWKDGKETDEMFQFAVESPDSVAKQLMEWRRDDPTDPEFHREGLQAEFMQGLQRWLQSVKDDDTVEGSDTYYFVEHLLDNVKDHNREGTLPWKEESE